MGVVEYLLQVCWSTHSRGYGSGLDRCSPALYLVWQCVQPIEGTEPLWLKIGDLRPLYLQSNKVNDSIKYH